MTFSAITTDTSARPGGLAMKTTGFALVVGCFTALLLSSIATGGCGGVTALLPDDGGTDGPKGSTSSGGGASGSSSSGGSSSGTSDTGTIYFEQCAGTGEICQSPTFDFYAGFGQNGGNQTGCTVTTSGSCSFSQCSGGQTNPTGVSAGTLTISGGTLAAAVTV